MKKSLAILISLFLFVASSFSEDSKISSTSLFYPFGKDFNIEDFNKRFDDLYLSDEPINYNKCFELYNWLSAFYRFGIRMKKTDLTYPTKEEKVIICKKFKECIQHKPREVDSSKGVPHIGDANGILKIYCIDLLGMFGTKDDILFLKKLLDDHKQRPNPEFKNTLFEYSCEKAILLLEKRQNEP
jgi:hypothetical protein